MRGKKAFRNTIMGLMEEVISVICGFILPRLILSTFGSKYNGLTVSISQFLSYAVLMRAGLGGATRAALYKPIAEGNQKKINSIVKATDIYMKKIGLVLAGAIVMFAAIYPMMVANEFGWLFTFTLFLIIGASTFAESFFGITYLIVLQADQNIWVSTLMKSCCIILNTIIASILIYCGGTIHVVKAGSAIVYVLSPIIVGIYVRKKYKIDLCVEPDYSAISQRWDAFWHQIAAFVMENTDIVILTIFTNMLEVSVYGVYRMVTNGLRRGCRAISGGLEASFGNMIAKKETGALKENLSVIELINYSIATIIFTTGGILILQFVSVYTKGVDDVEYIRPTFAYLFMLASCINILRYPYQIVVQAAGHYKQTRNGAIFEPIMNICLSIIFVVKYGIVGVTIGTLAATLFRTIQYASYMRKNVVDRSPWKTVLRYVASLCEALVIMLIVRCLHLPFAQSYRQWIINGVITISIATVVVCTFDYVLYRKDCIVFIKKMKGVIKK